MEQVKLEQQKRDLLRYDIDRAHGLLYQGLGEVRHYFDAAKTAVSDGYSETAESIKEELSLKNQISKHPWAAVGAALLGGFLVERAVDRKEEDPKEKAKRQAREAVRPTAAETIMQVAIKNIGTMALTAVVAGLREKLSETRDSVQTPGTDRHFTPQQNIASRRG